MTYRCQCRRCTHPEVPACLCCGEEDPARVRMIPLPDGRFAEDLCLACDAYHQKDGFRLSHSDSVPLADLGPLEYIGAHAWRKA